MESDYDKEIIDVTFQELAEFIRWYNLIQGHDPLIVGGWAAWAYHQGLGSKDIDVVFPGASAKQVTLSAYFKSHGYAEKRDIDFFDFEFSKERRTKDGRIVELLVDAVSMDRNVTVPGTDLIIPWALAEKHKQRFSFAKNAEAWIVKPELLLMYKAGALIGRQHYLLTALGSRRAMYLTKLWKDARDVSGLFDNCAFDSRLLSSLLASCGFGSGLLSKAFEIGQRQFEGDLKERFTGGWHRILETSETTVRTRTKPVVRLPGGEEEKAR